MPGRQATVSITNNFCFNQGTFKNACVSSCKIPVVIIQLEQKLKCVKKFQKKILSIKLNKNPFSGTQVGTCGQTDMKATGICLQLFYANA
jgi:hypothetical protein